MSRFHWGWRISLVYTAFALSTLGFVAFAMTQRVDLVREDYYQESLRTTDAQIERKLGRDAGVKMSVDGSSLRISIVDPSKRPVSARLHLYRPDNPSRDQQHELVAAEDVDFELPLAGDVSGQWRAILRWTVDGQAYSYEQSIMLP